MFTEFHGLSENPFTIMPNPRLAWLGAGMRGVRAELCKAVLEGRSLAVLSGGPGVGKSLALSLLARDLKQSGAPCRIHALNCGLQVSAAELLRRVDEDAAGDDGTPATDELTVLLIDEAQHLGSAELGALLQETELRGDGLRVVLAGTPELELAMNEALAEHPVTVATHCSLEPLPPDEISSYIAGRLQVAGGRREIFTAGAIECLTRHSGGVPCRLNVLCSTALFLAWRESRQDVDASMVEAALPAFNLRGSLTEATEPRTPAPRSTSTRRTLIEAAVLPEAKDPPVAELESAVLEASAPSAALDGVRSAVMEFVTARAAQSESIARQTSSRGAAAHGSGAARPETSEYATDVAVAATPVSSEIAQLRPKAKPVARQHRPVLVPIWAQMRRPALYVPVAAVAAIVFLLVAIDWPARVAQPVGHATALMTSPSLGPTATEPELAKGPPTLVMQPANDYIPQNGGKRASATEPVDPSPVHVDPQDAEDALQSAVEGRPPETIGPVELAKLLARARQQIEAFALITPPGDNALETLRRVLAVMPTQPDALQGIHDIASRYAVLATQAERRGEHDLAERYVDRGLHLVPDHSELLALQRMLATQPAQQPQNSETATPSRTTQELGSRR